MLSLLFALVTLPAQAAELPLYCNLDPASNPVGEFISVNITESTLRVRFSDEMRTLADSGPLALGGVKDGDHNSRVYNAADGKATLSVIAMRGLGEEITALIGGRFIDVKTQKEQTFNRPFSCHQ